MAESHEKTNEFQDRVSGFCIIWMQGQGRTTSGQRTGQRLDNVLDNAGQRWTTSLVKWKTKSTFPSRHQGR
jgi:hypothetical protein